MALRVRLARRSLDASRQTGWHWRLLDAPQDVDGEDRRIWVEEQANTYFGDANLDGEFNTADFVSVFQNGEYEDAVAGNSTWSDGDWNGDTEFDSGDFVTSFQGGGFEQGPREIAAVPEPSARVLLAMSVASPRVTASTEFCE